MSVTPFAQRNSPLHRLNPLTKLVAALLIAVAGFASPTWWGCAILLAAIVGAALVARCVRRLVRLAAPILLPVLAALIVLQSLFFPGARAVIWHAGPVNLSLEGLTFSVTIALRVTVFALAFLLLQLTTHPGDLMGALTAHGMAPKAAYVITATLQIAPAIQERARAILLAQRARGLDTGGGPIRRTRALLPLIGPLALTMITDSAERATAMEARGFGASRRRTTLADIPDSAAQRVARWAMAALTVGAAAAAIWWGRR